MAINLHYEASPLLTGAAAYDTGLAEGLRQQQEDALRRDQLARDAEHFDRQFGENARQFDVSHSLDQMRVEGQLGAQDRQAAEQARQFDVSQGFNEKQLGRQTQNDTFNQNLATHQQDFQRYGLLQKAAADDADRQAQLAGMDIRGQYGLMSDAMGNQTRLAQEAMQQQGMTARQGQQQSTQYGMQWQAQAAKQMQADWQNVQNALPRLDPNERQELIDKFYQRWQDSNVPMPVEMPSEELPEWMDQGKQWDKANAWAQAEEDKGHKIFLVPDPKTGMPSIMRGSPAFPQTPEGMRQQHEFEMQKEQGKYAAKDSESEAKIYRDAAKHDQEQQHAAEKHAQSMQLEALKARMPREAQYTKTTEEAGKVTDYTKYQADLTAWQADMKTLTDGMISQAKPPQQQGALPADHPLTPGMDQPQQSGKPVWETLPTEDRSDASHSTGYMYYISPEKINGDMADAIAIFGDTKPAKRRGLVFKWEKDQGYDSYSPHEYYPVTNREELAALPLKARYILPDGTTGTSGMERQQQSSATVPVASKDDMRTLIHSGRLRAGDTVITPSGRYVLTEADIAGA